MTDNLLDGDPNSENTTTDPGKNYLNELVGPGKKFPDNEELAKGKWHGDVHSKVVEQENKTYREMILQLQQENAKRATLDDLIQKLQTPADTQQTLGTNQPQVTEKPALDPAQMKNLFREEIVEYNKTQKENDNFNAVKNKLIERFGNNYQSAVRSQVEALGLSDEDVNALARKSPTAFFNTLGLNQTKQDTSTTPHSTVTSFGGPTKKRYLSHYEELAKTNPKIYLDRKTQIQMDKDAQEYGEAFFDV